MANPLMPPATHRNTQAEPGPNWIARRLGNLRNNDILFDFLRSPGAIFAVVVLVLFTVAALFPGLIAPQRAFDLNQINLMDAFLPPLWSDGSDPRFLLGTDDQGRDMISAIIYGMRVSLMIGVAGVALALAIGVTLGLIAGYLGGWIGTIIMRIADVQLTFPAILIAVMIDGISRAAFGQGQHEQIAAFVLIVAIGLSGWVQYARAVRSVTMVERRREYVEAAVLIGIPTHSILLRHILPNVMTSVLVIATIHLAIAIILEATLSFVGLGIPPTQPSLGTLIRIGNGFLFSGEWWIAIMPGGALVLLVLAINLLGDFLRDALNPRLK